MIDSFGGRTDPKFREVFQPQPAGRVETHHPHPYAPYFELVFLLEAVCDRPERRFTMVELGAGYGAWTATAHLAATSIGRSDLRWVAVEMVPHHLDWLREHLATNGVDPAATRIVEGAISSVDGDVTFDDQGEDFGQSIASGTQKVKSYRLETLLADEAPISLIHCDIQGAEAELFRDADGWIAENVERVLVSTHRRADHREIKARLVDRGFDLVYDFGVRKRERTIYGDVQFLDGLLCAVNRRHLGR